MEHSLPSFPLEQPWRTRAIVAAVLAVLELFVLIIAVLALVSGPVSHRVDQAAQAQVLPPVAKPKPKPKPRHAVALPTLSRAQTAVLILNGNGRAGSAHSEADKVRSLGYLIAGVGNASRNDYTHTLLMYRPGYRPEALRLAKDLGGAPVSPLDGLTVQGLQGAHLALVVGA